MSVGHYENFPVASVLLPAPLRYPVSVIYRFARSADDVSLRRLANYSLSPVLKAAFEQVYGPPYLARMLFAELGRNGAPNLFLRLDYDGSIHTNGGAFGRAHEEFGVIAGTAPATAQMERFLREKHAAHRPLDDALAIAADAWAIGHLALADEPHDTLPDAEKIAVHLTGQLATVSIEAAVLERTTGLPMTWRALPDRQIRPLLEKPI